MKVEDPGRAPWIGKRAKCARCGFVATLDVSDRADIHFTGSFWISCPTCAARLEIA